MNRNGLTADKRRKTNKIAFLLKGNERFDLIPFLRNRDDEIENNTQTNYFRFLSSLKGLFWLM